MAPRVSSQHCASTTCTWTPTRLEHPAHRKRLRCLWVDTCMLGSKSMTARQRCARAPVATSTAPTLVARLGVAPADGAEGSPELAGAGYTTAGAQVEVDAGGGDGHVGCKLLWRILSVYSRRVGDVKGSKECQSAAAAAAALGSDAEGGWSEWAAPEMAAAMESARAWLSGREDSRAQAAPEHRPAATSVGERRGAAAERGRQDSKRAVARGGGAIPHVRRRP
jgi:hypothetical protein